MVCGQIHPQNILPKTMVNKTMQTIKANMAITTMKKSCGQNTCPNKINLRSMMLKSIN